MGTGVPSDRAAAGRSYWILVVLTVALGLGLRLHWVLVASNRTTTTGTRWSRVATDPPNQRIAWLHDEYLYYVSTAVNAFHGRGFFPQYNEIRDGVYVPPPAQPAWILLVYKAADRVVEPRSLFVLQAVFGALMVAFAAELGRALATPSSGILMALLVAVYPDFVFWTGYLMTDANYVAGLALVLLLLARWAQVPSAGRAAAAALALGLLDLQRGYALYLGPVLAIWAIGSLGWRRGRAPALAFLAIPLFVVSPWLARNLRTYGEPIVVSSNDGIALHQCNFSTLDASRTPYWEDAVRTSPGPVVPELERKLRDAEGKLRHGTTYYTYSREYFAVARSYILDNPLHFLRNYLVKLTNAFVVTPDFSKGAVPLLGSPRVYRALHFALLLGGLAGLLASVRRRPAAIQLMAFVFAYFALLRGLFLLERLGRWDLPLRLFLMLFLAAGAQRLAVRLGILPPGSAA